MKFKTIGFSVGIGRGILLLGEEGIGGFEGPAIISMLDYQKFLREGVGNDKHSVNILTQGWRTDFRLLVQGDDDDGVL